MRRQTLALATLAVLAAAGTSVHAAPAGALSVVAHWPGPDGGWDFSSFDPIHRRFYIARTDGVTAVDVDTGQVTAHLLTASRTHAAVPINGGAEILVTDGATGSALIADAMTGKLRATIKTGQKPDAAMVEPVSGLVMVMDNAGGGIALIDPKAGALVATIPVEGALESAAADGAGRVFINIEDKNEIVVVDIAARKVAAHYKLDGCESPSGLAYAPNAGVLISACANGVAKVVAAETGKVVGTLAIGLRPDATLYDAQRQLAFIPTGGDGVINVISAAAADDVKVISKAPSAVGTRSGAIDDKTGRLYLPAAKFAAATTAGGRATAVPGTFEVLVLDRP